MEISRTIRGASVAPSNGKAIGASPSRSLCSLGGLILIYLVIRFLILLSHSDTIHLELYRGTLAIELMEGLRLPWGDYLADPYALAPFFNAILTIPFFLMFGQTLFALKLLPFFWHLASLVAWFFVWKCFFPPRQVFWILLLFVLAPPRIIEYTLVNHGTHFESILWTALSLLFLRRGQAILLGLVLGLAGSLHPINWVTAAVILFYSTLSGRPKEFYLRYVLGFLAGFSPWLLYNFYHGWMGFDWPLKHLFYPISFEIIFSNFREVFLRSYGPVGLKGLLGFRYFSHPLNRILTDVYLGIYLLSLFFLIVRKWGFWKDLRNGIDIIALTLIYQILLLLLVVVTQFGYFEYYLFPAVPFMGMTIVLAIEMGSLFLRRGVMIFCLVVGCAGSFSLVQWKAMGQTRFLQGYSYPEMAEVIADNFGQNPILFRQKVKDLMKNRSPEIQKIIYEHLSKIL